MSDEHKSGDGKFFFGLFLGGLIGALTIFFFGTPEGKKTGKAIGKKGRELLSDVEDRVDELKEQGRELLKEGEELKEELKSQIMDKKEELTAEAVSRIDKALESVESLQQKGIETTANLRRQFKNVPKKSSPQTEGSN